MNSKLRNNKPVYLLYQIYKYLGFVPLLVISTIICSTMAVVLSILINPQIGYYGGIWWARFNTWTTPMRLTIKGSANIDRNRSYVVVSNHQSYFDILALVGFLPLNLKWVMKQELRKVPFFGFACRKVGHIFVDRSNREAAIAAIRKAKATIKNRTGIMFMAEGTRSASGKLRKFKKGAFRFALDIDLPILPVTIAGTKDILPKNTMALFPGRACMTIHAPIDVRGYDVETIDKLISLTRKAILKGL